MTIIPVYNRIMFFSAAPETFSFAFSLNDVYNTVFHLNCVKSSHIPNSVIVLVFYRVNNLLMLNNPSYNSIA